MGETSEITFRKMIAEDSDAVAEIEIKSFSLPWKRKDFFDMANNKNAEYIVGILDEKIIAYAGAWIAFEEAEVMNIAVDPDFRGNGFGKKIFAELIRVCKLRGATAITLEVRPSNFAAVKLYESFGLKTVGRRKNYYDNPTEDALIMWNTSITSDKPYNNQLFISCL
ncbi:MAG: ribosomal protein S18-alanine N-acetyltransferase [Selenomonadaceae bacterium]|nr:ribosomal protein S18-alanine N-acetyltransferase [Selenomonadaceae bacterium]